MPTGNAESLQAEKVQIQLRKLILAEYGGHSSFRIPGSLDAEIDDEPEIREDPL